MCEAGFMVRSALFFHVWAKEILSAVSNFKRTELINKNVLE